MQQARPAGALLGLEGLPEVPVGLGGWDLGTIDDRADMQPRPAHQQREAAAPPDHVDRPAGEALVVGERDDLIWARDVEQVMRYARAVPRRGLGGPDVHPAV